jgi:hypothetical protein
LPKDFFQLKFLKLEIQQRGRSTFTQIAGVSMLISHKIQFTKLFSTTNKYLNNNEFSDFIIINKNDKIPTHKIIFYSNFM